MEAPSTHQAKITEQNRALIIVMIDQSGSMNEPYAISSPASAVPPTKAEVVAELCNALLSEIVARCRQGTTYRHYFDIGVIGYSGAGVYSALPDSLGKMILSPAELAYSIRRTVKKHRRRKTTDGHYVTLFSQSKIWVEPTADGRTPTLAAFERLTEMLYTWRAGQRSLEGFPPTIIHITDGEATDARAEQLLATVARIEPLGTADGAPLRINVHISATNQKSTVFPTDRSELPPDAALLFDMSSIMPASYAADIAAIKGEQYLGNGVAYRAMAYNAGVDTLIRIMNIGSSTISRIA